MILFSAAIADERLNISELFLFTYVSIVSSDVPRELFIVNIFRRSIVSV